MSDVDLRVEPPKERELRIPIETAFAGETERIVRDVVREMPGFLKSQMANSPPTGRTYYWRDDAGQSHRHIASSLGNAPRNMRGDLSGSFRGEVISQTEGAISMLWYGKYLDEELDRPFIDRAFEESVEKAL